ncbi:MAG TPA: selenocysteine-specific translation elongation factor [Candidatus Baltobacteraceae bacterium]|nr:selenocysteine-specific translation elongation factor [Candidatus Baltobacteraceae bacterium]
MHIVGTAGHVDHGKSSLVSALTGTNPDRWLEEQLRGMTLDLGFAHLRFDDGIEAGIVDVPGHERFLHNMLAGAAGMELLLLVIAATEGVMPQTVEHLQILRYLNVRDVLVVVTKMDLVPPEEGGAVCSRIHEQLRGTIAQDAGIFAVSTATGYQLDVLRTAIHDSLAKLSARDPDAPAYLPIDRVFALPGHGTIVTGTLMQGRIAVGDSLKLEPSGKPVRVRSLQSFGQKRERVEGGARVAVNVPNVDVHEIARGDMLVAPQFAPADAFAVAFTPLPEALPILRRRNAVRAYVGSAEILGTLVLDDVPHEPVELHAQLFLRRSTVAHPGTAFVVRRLSPKNLLGGGRIEGRTGAANGAAHAAETSRNPHEAMALEVLRKAGLHPLSAAEIAREANVREDALQPALGALVEQGEALRVARPVAFVDARAAQTLLDRALDHLAQQHRSEPWAMGSTSLALARAFEMDEPLLLRVLGAYAEEGRIAHRSGYFALTDHTPKLSSEQQAFFEHYAPADPASPFAPTPLAQVVAAVKQSRINGIGKAFDTLLAKGALVKVGDDVYRGAQIAQIRARVEQFLRSNKQMTMAQFRDQIGTSRKYAVPLLEWFDARGITVRSGDYRMLRSKPGAHGET